MGFGEEVLLRGLINNVKIGTHEPAFLAESGHFTEYHCAFCLERKLRMTV